MLITKSGGTFLGQGVDHHFKSSLFRSVLQLMALNFIVEVDARCHEVIQITWSSHRPSCCRENTVYTSKLSLVDEEEFLLGPGYNITAVDFGTRSTQESIDIASKSDIIVGGACRCMAQD